LYRAVPVRVERTGTETEAQDTAELPDREPMSLTITNIAAPIN
jgi:hypothetical protein